MDGKMQICCVIQIGQKSIDVNNLSPKKPLIKWIMMVSLLQHLTITKTYRTLSTATKFSARHRANNHAHTDRTGHVQKEAYLGSAPGSSAPLALATTTVPSIAPSTQPSTKISPEKHTKVNDTQNSCK
jgi:hypothetical protein